ncbi:MAG: CDP-diacylglycerol--glycerol-3-phosphate 3-phosphatidyltransferase [Gammaproteobacteria bacterium]|nr:CDP-diacylglycerol--glycerol-3-phosphate 3-phosphatidyltransferase [Gammaproteobacteria bacterium]MDE0093447.1 CDP-diacylglycerol--glycerol-3-phosphate 3-phosphatidyltransferase [Gammaproteobacteria bacterium]MDE0253071.1 CDP-diacylglycerol--glycerol-3-phosphate 3-phosphatidyltransferase [Gammaproteobacteria bacterium]MDE0402285.1 CDP-diacylglycerol--glycerol-3-phosphate 3-phosphatidyltransferase [Gammaproteobacteria bacterium]MXX94169.1 CDP-diacylglycerol--glycerol-3-phosphate 3-phosphatidy
MRFRLRALVSPNMLSVYRIALVPIFVIVYLVTDEHRWLAGVVFAIASLTDWLDGFLARRYGISTSFGAFLDPVADKLAVIAALVVLIGSFGSLLLTLPGLVIVGRELLISSLREWMAEMNVRSKVAVNNLAKVKTFLQMLAIFILLSNPPKLSLPLVIIGIVLMYFATLFTLWSLVVHMRAAWPTIRSEFFSK